MKIKFLASFRKSENEIRAKYEKSNKDFEDSYYSDSEDDNIKKFSNIKMKKNKNRFGQEKRDVDKFFVYKCMEDLNNLEHKFHQDKNENSVSNGKFNFRYYNMKRQL